MGLISPLRSSPAVPYAVDPNQSNSLLAWNYDPACVTASNATTISAATIYMLKIPIPRTITITNILASVGTAGTSYTNAQLGLYSSAGTYLSATAVQASAGTNGFGTTGVATIALQAAQTIIGSPTAFVWAAIHAGTNNATAFTIHCGASALNIANAGTATATSRFCYQTGHITNNLATIGNLTPASNNPAPNVGITWMGVS